jgi:hypothetical protein
MFFGSKGGKNLSFGFVFVNERILMGTFPPLFL